MSAPTIADAAVQADPYPFYATLREAGPVHHDPATGLWLVLDHALVTQVARDWQTYSSDFDMRTDVAMAPDAAAADALFRAEGWVVPDVLTQVDPPRHKPFRALVEGLFTAPVLKRMDAYLRDHVRELIDALEGRTRADILAEVCVPLPLAVIADQLGVPRADMPELKRWTDAIVETLGLMLTPQRKLECTRRIIAFQHYFVAAAEARRAEPREDLLTGLVQARLPDGRPLTTEELLALTQQLLVAGNETTRNHLAKCVLLLIEHPAEAERLAADPAAIPGFVEESLRYEAPVQGLFRIAKQGAELGGVTLPPGAQLWLGYGPAGRDPEMFAEPDRFDPTRPDARKHLAFGAGIHFCVGNQLARAELAIALGEITRRMTNLRLAAGSAAPRHLPNIILRGLERLEIEWDWR